jgi:hypothetical protein
MTWDERKGRCVYKEEVIELMKRLNAEGILLVVIRGNRNIDTFEISSAVETKHVADVGEVLIKTGVGYIENLKPYIDGRVEI